MQSHKCVASKRRRIKREAIRFSATIGNFEYSFYFSDVASNWNDAQVSCGNNDGMNLASITSQELQDFVTSQFASMTSDAGMTEPVFIGGQDQNTEGTFEWIGGEPWDYSQPLRTTANDDNNDCVAYSANSDTGEQFDFIFIFNEHILKELGSK